VLVEAARSPSRPFVSSVGARRGGEEDEGGAMLAAEAMRERLRLCEEAAKEGKLAGGEGVGRVDEKK
jgi:hypothetical protein